MVVIKYSYVEQMHTYIKHVVLVQVNSTYYCYVHHNRTTNAIEELTIINNIVYNVIYFTE